MKIAKILAAGILFSLAVMGCGGGDNGTPAAKETATATGNESPATPATMPATLPTAATQPMQSSMLIDQRQEWFPPAMLRLTTSDGTVVARLYSDDPTDVLTGKQEVNSFDFQMDLKDITNPAQISRSIGIIQSSNSDWQNSPYGIVLAERKEVLQPIDVTVRFTNRGDFVEVILQGQFRTFDVSDPTSHVPGAMVPVMALFEARVPQQ